MHLEAVNISHSTQTEQYQSPAKHQLYENSQPARHHRTQPPSLSNPSHGVLLSQKLIACLGTIQLSTSGATRQNFTADFWSCCFHHPILKVPGSNNNRSLDNNRDSDSNLKFSLTWGSHWNRRPIVTPPFPLRVKEKENVPLWLWLQVQLLLFDLHVGLVRDWIVSLQWRRGLYFLLGKGDRLKVWYCSFWFSISGEESRGEDIDDTRHASRYQENSHWCDRDEEGGFLVPIIAIIQFCWDISTLYMHQLSNKSIPSCHLIRHGLSNNQFFIQQALCLSGTARIAMTTLP